MLNQLEHTCAKAITSTLRRACDISRVAIKVLHGRASGLQVECTWLDGFFPACSTSSDGFDKHVRLFLSLERRAAEAVASRLEILCARVQHNKLKLMVVHQKEADATLLKPVIPKKVSFSRVRLG